MTHSFLLILDQKNSIKNGKKMEVITERKKEKLSGSKRKERKTGRKNKSVETYNQFMLLTSSKFATNLHKMCRIHRN